MPIDLGRRLIAAGVVGPEEVEAALFLSVVRGVHFARILIDRGVVTERQLDEELERLGGLGLRHVVVSAELVSRLPRAMCRRLAALPTRLDPMTGVVDVAAADPLDPHVPAEFGFQFGAPIRVLRAPIGAIEEALRQLELGSEQADRSRPRRATPPFPHGAPQSTIPPPPGEEAPIPLVRRIDLGTDPKLRLADVEPVTREMATRRRPTMDDAAHPPFVDDDVTEVVLPLRSSRIISEGRARPAVTVPHGFRGRTGSRGRSEPPAVSFPSQPPPPDAETWLDEPTNDLATNGAGHPIAPVISADLLMPPAPGLDEIAAPRLPRDLIPTPRSEPPPGDPETLPARRTGRPPLMADLHRPGAEPPTLTSTTRMLARPVTAVAPMRASEPAEANGNERPRRGTLPPPFGSPDADDGARIVRSIRDAPNRDELVRLTLRGLRRVARRVAVFAVRSSGYQGWACNVEFGDQDALKQIHIPSDVPSILATAAATAFYLGPIPGTPGHAALLGTMQSASPDVACVAVRVAGRAAMILLADELDDTMLGTRFMEELARAASEGLAQLLGR